MRGDDMLGRVEFCSNFGFDEGAAIWYNVASK